MGEDRAPQLLRVLSKWDLLAYGINQVIGAGIFLLPAALAAQIGNWGPLAFIAAGFASLASALCFAEVGSRFDGTGGSYLYVNAAYGRFAAFEIGWIQWFVRVSSLAAIVDGTTLALGFFWPSVETGIPRTLCIVSITLGLGFITVWGIRQSAWLINALTIGKLLPLALFIAFGVFYANWSELASLPAVSPSQAATAALLLVFAFGGFDTISVPAGEARDPRRDLPFAFVGTIAGVTIIMTLIQTIVLTTLGEPSLSGTPLADAASAFLGPFGAAIIAAGAVVSMTGNNVGGLLAGSRLLFALAENDQLPRVFARIHPVHRTPLNAVWFTTVVALILALSGSFTLLAAASAVARLVTYAGVAAATLTLRQPRFLGRVPTATFTVPFGVAVPVASLLLSLVILAGTSWREALVGSGALLFGTLLFFLHDRLGRNRGSC